MSYPAHREEAPGVNLPDNKPYSPGALQVVKVLKTSESWLYVGHTVFIQPATPVHVDSSDTKAYQMRVEEKSDNVYTTDTFAFRTYARVYVLVFARMYKSVM